MVVEGKSSKLPFNHLNASDLILSTIWLIEHSLSLKCLLFLSFQISQTVANQMTWDMEWHVFAIPPLTLNWVKWSGTWAGMTAKMSSHPYMKCQTVPKILQCKNKCWEDSIEPHTAESHYQEHHADGDCPLQATCHGTNVKQTTLPLTEHPYATERQHEQMRLKEDEQLGNYRHFGQRKH